MNNRKIFAALAGVVATMAAIAWASAPLYDWFCRVTGYGGQTLQASDNDQDILSQIVTVRFDASLERGMPWEFRPVDREMSLRIGETGLAFYEAHNPTKTPVAGTASYNVFPFAAGEYFIKIECFCFEQQTLQPGERVQMPVSFYVDPEIIDEREIDLNGGITLSYTFHTTEIPVDEELKAESSIGETSNM